MSTNSVHYYSSPIGDLRIEFDGPAIVALQFSNEGLPSGTKLTGEPKEAFDDYFLHRKNLSLSFEVNGTDFQKKVWQEVSKIPFGSTCSYLELAERCGGKTYTRAVASANGANPLLLIVPCHRVIGSNNSLTGYAGGLERKRWLLDWEKGQGSLFE
ncbi:MAG: methylated-DNA--[protein]-cysteine S-methyltransferase [Flavobacteriales bacterium]